MQSGRFQRAKQVVLPRCLVLTGLQFGANRGPKQLVLLQIRQFSEGNMPLIALRLLSFLSEFVAKCLADKLFAKVQNFGFSCAGGFRLRSDGLILSDKTKTL